MDHPAKEAPSLSVVLPCYNEEGNLPHIFSRFHEALRGVESEVEVIIVDNGSTDGSSEVLAELADKPGNEFARLVEVKTNKGYGYGIMAGVRQAKGEIIAWTHADLQTPPEDVLSAYDLLCSQDEITGCFLKGRRRNRNAADAFFTFVMSLFASAMLKTSLADINAQPKMFHRGLLSQLDCPPMDFSLDLYFLYKAKKAGLALLQYDVFFGERLHGEAKGGGSLKGKINLIRRTVGYILSLKKTIARQKVANEYRRPSR